MRRPVRSQRNLPKSSLHIVETVFLRLASILHDPAVCASQRQMALALLLTAPRWLWPEPDKPLSGRLPPHARPHLIRHRAELVLQNRWEELAGFTFQCPPEPAAAESIATPQRPGLIAGASAHRLLLAAQHGRLTSAWKQLFSHGIAPPTADTEARLQVKWWLPNASFQLEGASGGCCHFRSYCHPSGQSQP